MMKGVTDKIHKANCNNREKIETILMAIAAVAIVSSRTTMMIIRAVVIGMTAIMVTIIITAVAVSTESSYKFM